MNPTSDVILIPSDHENEAVVDNSNESSLCHNLVELPVARIRRLMKTNSDVKHVSQEAALLVTKASELLIQHLARESLKSAQQHNAQQHNQKTLQYQDLCTFHKNKILYIPSNPCTTRRGF